MIISGGFNVYAREVEDVIHAHPAVQEAAIFGVPDAEWGEAVAAAVIVRPGMDVDEAAIIGLCRDRLASYKKPRHVWFVGELPRNTIGKVMKPALAQAFAERNH
jgi:acyl-CoA synthetase (AMP-forming)/AMP-acid ligase II